MPFCLAIAGATLTATNSVLAQSTIIPDATLGTENSAVTRNVVIRGILSDRVEGGAARGINLFHSFEQFNVSAGRGVYFANPAGIENILSRVTGSNRSEVLGRLGVLGNANLFLLNPNGILFGPNASLDITGSFTATTANAIQLGDRGFFSATQPQQSTLLAITPGALLYNQIAVQGGRITNAGNLVAGQDLTLAANTLNLEGQLQAGRDLTLQAQDTLRIRDSVTAPFIASAGRNLLVQGNQTVDIFALNHPNSGLFSGGNMVLRSTNPVGGDAHYWSGGNFRIEQLNGNLGDLYSPYDPVIRSLGDVAFSNYSGASLHILAAGSVNVGNIQIEAPELGTPSVEFIRETVQLPDGSGLSIDGSTQPTLDIRAGVSPSEIGIANLTGIVAGSFFPVFPTLTNVPTSADITVANIKIDSPNGLVFLTNQYAPNPLLLGGNITVTAPDYSDEGIDVRFLPRGNDPDRGNGGSVILDSRSNIALSGGIATVSTAGRGGNVTLLARGDISLGRRGLGVESGINTRSRENAGDVIIRAGGSVALFSTRIVTIGQDGNIDIRANSLSMSSGSQLESSTFGSGDAGRITIDVDDSVALSRSAISNNVEEGAVGNSGGIEINARSFNLSNGAFINASTSGNGDAGRVNINVDDAVSLESGSAIFNNVEEGGTGSSGGTEIRARSFTLSGNSLIDVSTFGNGNAGKITLDVDDAATLDSRSFIFNNIKEDATGSTGGVEIHARSLALNGGAQIFVGNVGGNGTLGNIFIDATDSVSLTGIIADPEVRTASTGIGNRLEPGSVGTGGDIIINTGLLSLSGGQISASTRGQGNAGSVRVSGDSISLAAGAGIFSSVDSGGVGNGGEIQIDAASLSINQSPIQTIVRGASEGLPAGRGNSGNITVNLRGDLEILDNGSPGFAGIITSIAEGVTETATVGDIPTAGNIRISARDISISGIGAQVRSTLDLYSVGESGNIDVQARSLAMFNRAEITAVTLGEGNAGDISIGVQGSALLTTNSVISSGVGDGGNGNSGDVNLEAGSLSVMSGSQFLTSVGRSFTRSLGAESERLPPAQGNGGNINITVRGTATFDGVRNGVPSGILSEVFSDIGGVGGDITIQSDSLVISNGARFSSQTNGIGRAGNIEIDAGQFTLLNNAEISSNTLSQANAGSIQIKGDLITLMNGGLLTSQSSGDGNAGNIFLSSQGLLQANDGTISTTSERSSGGAIAITAKDIRLNGDSDITTFVGSGVGGGGNITLTANSILAFNDSDILSFAQDGRGGNVTLNTRAFFGQNYRPAPFGTNPRTLDDNNRVDINASGAVSGIVTLPDVTFIQNSLTQLPQVPIDTNALLANSCIVRRNQPTGNFFITGSGGLPERPGTASSPTFPTGEVQNVAADSRTDETDKASSPSASSVSHPLRRPWKIGDPIAEPDSVYQLNDGQLVLSHVCP